VIVCDEINTISQTFKHIFTSPSSSHDMPVLDNDENDPENNQQPPKKTRRTAIGKTKANTRKAVAANLHMTRVTPRAIAYAAVQVKMINFIVRVFTVM
jgi:hypothetical protein